VRNGLESWKRNELVNVLDSGVSSGFGGREEDGERSGVYDKGR
jgi:hypothetical protein